MRKIMLYNGTILAEIKDDIDSLVNWMQSVYDESGILYCIIGMHDHGSIIVDTMENLTCNIQ